MARDVYRYTFPPHVPLADAEASLLLAAWGAGGLHGESRVRLDAGHRLDPARRACAVNAGTPAGRDVNLLFAAFLRREFGDDGFAVERVVDPHHAPHPQATPDGRGLELPVVDPDEPEAGDE